MGTNNQCKDENKGKRIGTPQRLLIFQQNGSGESKIKGVEKYGDGLFIIDKISIDTPLPGVIDNTSEYLPEDFSADLVLDFLKHPDLSHDLARICHKKDIPIVATQSCRRRLVLNTSVQQYFHVSRPARLSLNRPGSGTSLTKCRTCRCLVVMPENVPAVTEIMPTGVTVMTGASSWLNSIRLIPGLSARKGAMKSVLTGARALKKSDPKPILTTIDETIFSRSRSDCGNIFS